MHQCNFRWSKQYGNRAMQAVCALDVGHTDEHWDVSGTTHPNVMKPVKKSETLFDDPDFVLPKVLEPKPFVEFTDEY